MWNILAVYGRNRYDAPVPYSPQRVANAFLQLAADEGKPLTNMQLQKLVYFAHAWHLALKDAPLLNTPVHAWNFGPVIPPLYNALKTYGNGVVKEPIVRYDPITGEKSDFLPSKIDMPSWAVIKRVWNVYGNLTAGQLSTLTHKPGAPWEKSYKTDPFSEIPNDEITEFYKKGLKRK